MKFGFMKYFVFLVLSIPLVSFAVNSNISKIAFTTDSQTVLPNEISGTLTVQTQNSSGESENLSSTADATFRSSSPTGKFYSSSGVEETDGTMTMSSGSANKNFKYSDSTEGVHTITATVKVREGGAEWTTSQSITIGQDGNTNTDTDNTDDDTEDSDDTDTSDDSTSESTINTKTSSHGSSAKLSTYNKKSSVKVGAGRARTVLVNTPIFFEPETNQTSKSRTKKGDFVWSFGDGSSDSGRIVKHTYYFPGDYNVVLNTKEFGGEVVSRTKVKVIEPSIEIVNVITGDHGYVEVKNNSSMEVNINGWEIKSGKRDYSVAEDTIINPKSSIKIPNKAMHFDPVDQVSFIYPNDEVYMTYVPKNKEIITNNFAYSPPVYQDFNYEKPEVVEKVAEKPVTSSIKNIEQTASVGQVGIVGKFWGGLKSLFLVH